MKSARSAASNGHQGSMKADLKQEADDDPTETLKPKEESAPDSAKGMVEGASSSIADADGMHDVKVADFTEMQKSDEGVPPQGGKVAKKKKRRKNKSKGNQKDPQSSKEKAIDDKESSKPGDKLVEESSNAQTTKKVEDSETVKISQPDFKTRAETLPCFNDDQEIEWFLEELADLISRCKISVLRGPLRSIFSADFNEKLVQGLEPAKTAAEMVDGFAECVSKVKFTYNKG